MSIKYLVFGDGLLGNTFKLLLPHAAVVLPRAVCDITHKNHVLDAINYYRPYVVINAAGIVPRNDSTIETMFKVNAFAPHAIADVCHKRCKFIHVSTDCVFSGEAGQYTEHDEPDAQDVYGMSKLLGEPEEGLVIRTSFIGLPDPKSRGLLAWASQQTEVTGYDNVFWNGATTVECVRKLLEYAEQDITGIRHVYSYTLSKYELLNCARDVFGWNYILYRESDQTEDTHCSNKTLNSVYATGFIAKPIKQQLEEMYNVCQ